MRKIVFFAIIVLCLTSCKEDLSDYFERMDLREEANKRQKERNEQQAKRNEEQAKWNEEQAQRNADQAALNRGLRLQWEELAKKLDSLEAVRAVVPPVEPKLLSVTFAKAENPKLSADIRCEIVDDNTIECWLPGIVTEKQLIPQFTFDGTMVTIDGIEAVSGETKFNFKKPLKVTVMTSDKMVHYLMYVHSYTGLPILYINTAGQQEVTSKEYYIDASVKLVEDVRTRSAGDVTEAVGHIKGRGNSTWGLPKKPYRLKFDEKVSFLGEHKDKSWVLIPNWTDKSMLRNALSFYLGKMSNMDWTPCYHFVEVIFNGRYDGTYLLTEKVKVSNHRVAVGDDGFLLECNNWADREADATYFHTNYVDPAIVIKEPEDVQYDDANYTYIVNYMSALERALFSSSFTNPSTGWQKYMDMDSFVDWYLIHEMAKNVDCMFNFSTFMHLERGGKLKMGPLWDFDIAYGNLKESGSSYLKWISPQGNLLTQTKWYSRLMKDPAFVAKLKERFDFFYKHRNDVFMFLNDYADYLRYSVIENEDRWGTLYHYTYKNADIWGSYKNEVQDLKEWLNTRFEWMKSEYDKL